jgi:hypothetical protein
MGSTGKRPDARIVAVSFVDWFILVLPAWVAVVSLFILRRERARRHCCRNRVCECGLGRHRGFAAAARDMGLARSVVHKHVLKLEQALGTQLLRRSTRQVSPTETGQAFYNRCVQILVELDAAIAQVSELQELPRGELRINAPMSFGTLQLAPLMGEFFSASPIHTEAASCGVYPTNHTSHPFSAVPVLPARV